MQTTTINDENCTYMDYYAVCSGNYLPMFQENLLVPYGPGTKKD